MTSATKFVLQLNKATSMDPAMKTLGELNTRVQKPDTPTDVKETIEKTFELLDKKVEYCRKNTMPDTSNARMISEKTYTIPWQQLHAEGKVATLYSPKWMSGNGQGQLLQFLIRMQKAKRALEIGMFTGYVAMAMAEVLPDDGVVVTCELEQYLVESGRKTFDATPFGSKIDIRQGPAMESLDKLASEGQTFDIVYMDADKDGYLGYFKKLLDKNLLAAGGTLVVDNTLAHGFAYTRSGSTMDEFNKAVMADDRVDQILLPLCDGVSFIRRKGE